MPGRKGEKVRATTQDGEYPRPLLCRDQWTSLDGTWEFGFDDADVGLARRWFIGSTELPERIEVPFPPESSASGLGRTEFHSVVWYRRRLALDDLAPDGLDGRRLLVHFGAVDYATRVWCDGHLVAAHEGGQTPFTADVTDALHHESTSHVLVVRVEDDPLDPEQARGKQDWQERPHGIWYERTTGIWQTVWAECVPEHRVDDVVWTPDPTSGLSGEITVSRRPTRPTVVEVTVSLKEEVLADQSIPVQGRTVAVDLAIEALHDERVRDRLLWSPEQPTLVDIEIRLRDTATGEVLDVITSYAGLRSVGVASGAFLLNGDPYFLRAVLNQGYRPETHLAARDTAELRREVETIKELGFNCVRLHQKAEDPRWLSWADRLGLLVWGESASAYAFSPTAVTRFVAEWTAIVKRYRSHPALAVWVPMNESWGVPELATSPAQQSYSRALAQLTRAVDPTRPVVSNEGWEHVDSDILGLHDYGDAEAMRARYSDRAMLSDVVLRTTHSPHGRPIVLGGAQERAFLAGSTPVMVTEFGGVSLPHDAGDEESWGYSTAASESEYADLLLRQFEALRASSELAGFCYTQFLDTGQETNGLLFPDGKPKLPVETIREIVTGETRHPPPGDAR